MAAKKPFLLRLSPEVWDDLNQWAQEELRSVNGQIEYVLREALRVRRKRDRPGPEDDPDTSSARDPQQVP